MIKSKNLQKTGLLAMAIPMMVESILRSFMGTVNVSLLGNYSDNASAAVGVSNQIINVVVVAFNAITAGTSILINQYIGAKKEREARHAGMNALTVAAFLGVLASIVLNLFAEPMLRALSLEEALIPDAMIYLRLVGGASFMTATSSLISVLFRCHHNTKLPMFVVMGANVINVIGTSLALYGPFDLPVKGVAAVAVVRCISEIFTLVTLALLFIHKKYGYHIKDMFRFKMLYIRRAMGMGLMTSAEGFSYTASQVITTGFLSAAGAAALSAKVYVQNIEIYAYLMGSSLGQAAMILAGNMMGAGDTDGAHRYVNKIWRIGITFNIIFGTILFIFYKPVIGLFTNSNEIIEMARPLLAIDIAIHAARSFNHNHKPGLQAAGYVFVPMCIAAGSIWILNCGLAYVFTVVCGWGIVGIWVAAACDEWFRGICMCILWQTKRWKTSVAKIRKESIADSGEIPAETVEATEAAEAAEAAE